MSGRRLQVLTAALTLLLTKGIVMNLATKTPYYWNRSRESRARSKLRKCSAVQVNYLIRHGTRNPSPKDIQRIEMLARRVQQIKNYSIPQWLQQWENTYDIASANLLVEAGVREMVGLGQRIRAEYGQNFPLNYDHESFLFSNSWKPRTAQSASA